MPDKQHANHFSGSPLNRFSWLRYRHSFLNSIIELPTTRWILFNNGKPLMILPSENKSIFSLAYLTTQDLEPLLDSRPYFGQGKEVGELIPDSTPMSDKHSPTESVRHRGCRIVFLGLHETGERDAMSLPSSDVTEITLEGTPYFSLEVSNTGLTDQELQRFLDNTISALRGKNNLIWSEPLHVLPMLDAFTAAVVASAKSLVDWNQRNKFCPGCGSPSYSMWGGWKIACSSLLPWAESTDKPCFSAKGLHNFMHPRTDVVVIMIAVDERYDKIFLGRGRRYPGKYYSALAGFIEPGESLEDAVRREMLEEAGLFVWDINYHSGQPWPYPANVMIGFYARADSTKPVRIDLDKELMDARWFTRQDIKTVLDHPDGSRFRREDYQKMRERIDGGQDTLQPLGSTTNSVTETLMPNDSGRPGVTPATKDLVRVVDKPPFKVPPVSSIAGVLIRDWMEGKIRFRSDVQNEGLKGNL